ncbi:hypothetical protein JTB14_014880 [Gonioctena quinquepunctata]|nr:hypothetical protein JTB14_014880 [Gonioctena quinquepunctata]
MEKFRIALIQTPVVENRQENLQNAAKQIFKAKDLGAKLIALPECFNSPYGTEFFKNYAEPIPSGPTSTMLSKSAKENSIFLIGGTFPEVEDGKYYNTCTVWNPEGKLIAKYRKMHLFDMDIPGKCTFKESDVFTPGNELVTFDFYGVKVGIGICYDMRFEEHAKLYGLMGCSMIFYPAAFDMTTGPMHFELIQRARALDNQVFVCVISASRNDKGYIAWGYSQITNPWGKVIAQAAEKPEIIYADIDSSESDTIRRQIPTYKQRRTDIYELIRK